jgi:hypothetical protein
MSVFLGKNIYHIKKEYGDSHIQEDMLHDTLLLLSMNITAKHQKIKNSLLTKEEIDDIVVVFKDYLNKENLIEIDWNQTS